MTSVALKILDLYWSIFRLWCFLLHPSELIENVWTSSLLAFPCGSTVGAAVAKTVLETWLPLAAWLLSKAKKQETLMSVLWKGRGKHPVFLMRVQVLKLTDLVESYVPSHEPVLRGITYQQGIVHRVAAHLFPFVLPQFLLLFLVTFFTSSISDVCFILQYYFQLPEESNQGKQCRFLFCSVMADWLPLCCNSTSIFMGTNKPCGRQNSNTKSRTYREPIYTWIVSFLYSHFSVWSVFTSEW